MGIVTDQSQLHIAPVLLGTGMRLPADTGNDHLELEPTRVVASPRVTHIRYAVRSTR